MGGTELSERPGSGQIGERENGSGQIEESENRGSQIRESENGSHQTGEKDVGQIGDDVDPKSPCARPSCSTLATKKCSRCRAVYYCSR